MSKFNKLISIILPVYNGQEYLSQSIESCLNQTYTNIELIIVNDCSTDKTLEIAEGYAKVDSRIIVINNKENKKLPASLNVGHNEAKGDYITWTSDDNLYKSETFEKLQNAIVNQGVDMVYSDYVLINPKGEIVANQILPDFENVFFGNSIGACFLYKKEVFERNKGYNENLFLVEDYDFWLRATLHSSFFQIRECLYFYRIHGDSLTNEIKMNPDKNLIWKTNISKMYSNFLINLNVSKKEELAQYLSNALTLREYDSNWIYKNHNVIAEFKNELLRFNQIINKTRLEQIILTQTIHGFKKDMKSYKIKPILYLIKNYGFKIKTDNIKTIIKSYLNK